MVSYCLKSKLSFLELLLCLCHWQKKAILCAPSNDLIKAISEIALNTLKRNIALTSHYVHVLKKGCKSIKILSSKNVSFKRKKLLVKQAGEFIDPPLSFSFLPVMGLLVKQGWTMWEKIHWCL